MNTKLHTLCDNQGRPVRLYLTEGQRSDFQGGGGAIEEPAKGRNVDW